eukprot:3500754-Amphidinium_carterae.1
MWPISQPPVYGESVLRPTVRVGFDSVALKSASSLQFRCPTGTVLPGCALASAAKTWPCVHVTSVFDDLGL